MAAFPAPAGMNRATRIARKWCAGVPRACGDEPLTVAANGPAVTRSPRLRG